MVAAIVPAVNEGPATAGILITLESDLGGTGMETSLALASAGAAGAAIRRIRFGTCLRQRPCPMRGLS
jgi:hypothetical protein